MKCSKCKKRAKENSVKSLCDNCILEALEFAIRKGWDSNPMQQWEIEKRESKERGKKALARFGPQKVVQ